MWSRPLLFQIFLGLAFRRANRSFRFRIAANGRRYACARFTGTAAEIHSAWMRFIGEWIPDSGYQCENHPAIELYEPDFTVDPKTGAFSCLLCMPVRPQ